MAISVGNIDATDECFDAKFCVVVNNVVRGAWGAALLNAEYWRYLEKVVNRGAARGGTGCPLSRGSHRVLIDCIFESSRQTQTDE